MAVNKSNRSRKRRTRQFPQIKGKIVDDVELSLSTEYRAVDIRFQDKTSLTFALEPCFRIAPVLADWKSGDFKLLKRWQPVTS
ncbi:MAG: hypothetical protein WAN65_00610 [Candidatus Sulfotelmatobacter sp.]